MKTRLKKLFSAPSFTTVSDSRGMEKERQRQSDALFLIERIEGIYAKIKDNDYSAEDVEDLGEFLKKAGSDYRKAYYIEAERTYKQAIKIMRR